MIQIHGLHQKVIGSCLHGLDGNLDIPVSGKQDRDQSGMAGLRTLQQCNPINARHTHIAQQNINVLCCQHLQRTVPAFRKFHIVATAQGAL